MEMPVCCTNYRALEGRRAVGGWDPAANAILRSRFLYQLTRLVEMMDLGQETTLGSDRLAFRLRRGYLARVDAEMKDIMTDSVDLAGLVVANARAQAIIRSLSTKLSRSGSSHLKGSGFKG